MTVRSAYGKKTPVRQAFTEPSLTKQSFKKECDINVIMSKYQKSGLISHINTHEARYGETSAQSFTEAQYLVAEAQSMFAELPSKARRYFNDDPKAFLAFTENYDPETDKQQLIDLGLSESGIALPSRPGDEGTTPASTTTDPGGAPPGSSDPTETAP